MAGRTRLTEEQVTAFLDASPGWEQRGGVLTRTFTFAEYGAGVGFAVRVALAAERRDHHPEIGLHYGRVSVAWSTHDAGGITGLDLELAKRTDELYAG